MRPLVGIPCQADFREGSGRPVYCNNRTYVHAVEDAGGIPVLIPMLNDISVLESLLSRLDGLLLSGGGDIDSVRYDEDARPVLGSIDTQLDELEFSLVAWALQEDMPILGVCRGMQLLNVALGGSLYQDLEEDYPGAMLHCRRELPRNTLIHNIHVATGSRMEKILGTNELWINSLHHQAVKAPGANIYISGRAEDGVAELLEMPNHRFVVGIQGHPEEIYTQEAACARLFSAFIRACGSGKDSASFIIEKLPVADSLTVGA
ncbi:MAG: gamma-glutamyl-gamma-aminobutyrate hydrolase family protein [Ktedonobacteraceae bacterium]